MGKIDSGRASPEIKHIHGTCESANKCAFCLNEGPEYTYWRVSAIAWHGGLEGFIICHECR